MATRVTEPLVKAHLALWLTAKGAKDVTVSVDGAEPNPMSLHDVLTDAGYEHRHDPKSAARWTGRYTNVDQRVITVVSRPGFDIDALLPDGGRCVAECKGEPTPSGVKAGFDLTNFYTALGQLIMAYGAIDPAPACKIIAMPRTARLVEIAHKASSNKVLRNLGVQLILVDQRGVVTEV